MVEVTQIDHNGHSNNLSSIVTVRIDFTSYDHTATLVPIFSYGPHSDFFTGVYENNEVFYKILQALELK